MKKSSLGSVLFLIASFCYPQIYTSEIEVTTSANGNVGIGITLPPTKLSVGNGQFSLFGTGLDGSTYQRFVLYSDTQNGLYFDAPKDANGIKLPIQFNWRGGGTTPFYISSEGYVGFGTTNPGLPLHISSVGAGLYLDNINASKYYIASQTGNYLQFGLSGGGDSQSFVLNNGKIGIGTSDPKTLLQLEDPIQSRLYFKPSASIPAYSSSEGESVYMYWNNTVNRRIGLAATNDGALQAWVDLFEGNNSALNYISFGANASERMRINASGNVGIGYTSPTYKLDVSETIRAKNHLRLTGVGTNNEGLKVDDGYGSSIFSITRNASNEIRFHGYGDITFFNNGNTGSEKLRIKTDGKVGIGYTSPSYKLDVNGTIRGSNVSPSDIRFKKNLTALDPSGLDQVKGYQYRLKSDNSKHFGVIAQEVEAVYPHLVSTDEQGYKSVAYDEFIPLLIEKTREQDKKMQAQGLKIEKLEEELRILKQLLLKAKN